MDGKVKVILSGPVMKVDSRTATGRVYPREVFQREIMRLQESVQDGRLFATADNDSVRIELRKIAGRVDRLGLIGDEVSVDIELLRTKPGRKVLQLLEAGEVELKPSGFGSTLKGVVQDDYRMTHVAIVPKEDES